MTLSKRIAIIGGGPSGLAAAKALIMESQNFTVHLYEKNDAIGGLWYYTGRKHNGLKSLKDVNKPKADADDEQFSAMYKHMETNIRARLMEYADCHFPKHTQMYPLRQEVLNYLEGYGNTINKKKLNFFLNSNVLSLEKLNEQWKVLYSKRGQGCQTSNYDLVVVANGHFSTPYIPSVEGLNEWHSRDPDGVSHSKYYDIPEQFTNKKVLIVGSSASGTDIAIQASTTANKVYLSCEDKSKGPDFSKVGIETIGLVKKYDYEKGRSATTVDGDCIEGIDEIMFCTGYLYTVPFLKSYKSGTRPIVTDGAAIHDIYRQIFYIHDPSLAFIGLPKYVVPMPLAESQAAVMARVWNGRLSLPDKSQMLHQYEEELSKKGSYLQFHGLQFPADAEYCRSLQNWIDSAGVQVGFCAPLWDDQRYNDREETSSLKQNRIAHVLEYVKKLQEKHQPFTPLR